MKLFNLIFICLLIAGCSSNPLINQFSLPEGSGSQLHNGWNSKLNDGLIFLFKSVDGKELKSGANVAGKNAIYRVPSGTSTLQIQVNWLHTIMGPIDYALFETTINLKEGGNYFIQASRKGETGYVTIVDSSGAKISETLSSQFDSEIPVIIYAPY